MIPETITINVTNDSNTDAYTDTNIDKQQLTLSEEQRTRSGYR